MSRNYQLTPVSLLDLPGLERWLDRQGAKGLFPLSVGNTFSRFQKKEMPAGVRFRLVAIEKERDPSYEMRQFYQDSGWQYLFSIRRLWFVFWNVDPDAPEPYTDAETQGYNLNKLSRRIRLSVISNILLFLMPFLLVAAFLLVPPSRFDAQPVSQLLALPALAVDLCGVALLWWIFFLFNSWFGLSHALSLIRLRKQLAQGLNGVSFSSRHYVKKNLVSFGASCLLLICFLVNYLWSWSIPLEKASFPYLSLEEIEQVPLDGDAFDLSSDKEPNQMERSFSVLAPVYYTTTQRSYEALAPEGTNSFSPAGGADWYSPMLDATYFHLTFPAMGPMVARAKLYNMRLVNLVWNYEEVSCPGADLVIHATESRGVWQMIAVVSEGNLIVARYGGLENLVDHVDQFTALVR